MAGRFQMSNSFLRIEAHFVISIQYKIEALQKDMVNCIKMINSPNSKKLGRCANINKTMWLFANPFRLVLNWKRHKDNKLNVLPHCKYVHSKCDDSNTLGLSLFPYIKCSCTKQHIPVEQLCNKCQCIQVNTLVSLYRVSPRCFAALSAWRNWGMLVSAHTAPNSAALAAYE